MQMHSTCFSAELLATVAAVHEGGYQAEGITPQDLLISRKETPSDRVGSLLSAYLCSGYLMCWGADTVWTIHHTQILKQSFK